MPTPRDHDRRVTAVGFVGNRAFSLRKKKRFMAATGVTRREELPTLWAGSPRHAAEPLNAGRPGSFGHHCRPGGQRRLAVAGCLQGPRGCSLAERSLRALRGLGSCQP